MSRVVVFILILCSHVPLLAQTSSKMKDMGITSEWHRKQLNKMVFSTEKMDLYEPDTAAILKQVKLNAPLFIRFYLPQSLANYYQNNKELSTTGTDQWNYKKDGEPRLFIMYYLYVNGDRVRYADRLKDSQASIENWTSWWTKVVEKDLHHYDEYRKTGLTYQYAQMVCDDLKPGEDYEIKIEMYPGADWKYSETGVKMEPCAVGSFQLSFTEEEHAQFVRERGIDSVKLVKKQAFQRKYDSLQSTVVQSEPNFRGGSFSSTAGSPQQSSSSVSQSFSGSSHSSSSSSSGNGRVSFVIASHCGTFDYYDGSSWSSLSGGSNLRVSYPVGTTIYRAERGSKQEAVHVVSAGDEGRTVYLCQ